MNIVDLFEYFVKDKFQNSYIVLESATAVLLWYSLVFPVYITGCKTGRQTWCIYHVTFKDFGIQTSGFQQKDVQILVLG